MYSRTYGKNSGTGLTVLAAIGLIAVALIFMPLICFWIAYFGGWIASLVVGGPLTHALNVLFQTEYFTADMLPWMAGALGWIGGFFKSTINTNKQ